MPHAMEAVAAIVSRRLEVPFQEVLERARKSLGEQGFEILGEHDLKEAMHRRLEIDAPKLRIIEVVQPQLAYRALGISSASAPFAGLAVVVREAGKETEVSAADPRQLLALLDNRDLLAIAEQTAEKLVRAIAAL